LAYGLARKEQHNSDADKKLLKIEEKNVTDITQRLKIQ